MESWEVTGSVEIGPVGMPQQARAVARFHAADWQAAFAQAPKALGRSHKDSDGEVLDISQLRRISKPVTSPSQGEPVTFVALIQQGMILDQKALAVGEDQAALQAQAEQAAQALNDAETGEAEGWTAVVVAVEQGTK